MNFHKNYDEINTILDSCFEEVNGYDFYRFIFPNNENKGELNYDYSKPNAVYLYQDDKTIKDSKRRLRRRIMLNDTFEDDYIDFIECNKALCGGLTYRGRANKLIHAQQMNALIFDLDNVGKNELDNILYRIYDLPSVQRGMGGDGYGLRVIPEPTFLVSSGSGLHLYYVFDRPIDLYPNIKLQLKALKYDLTFKIWEYKGTSKEKQIQYQSINQSFRMVGSTNEKYGVDIKAFRLGNKISLEELNKYARYDENRVDVNRPFRPSQYTREEAKEKFPDWYQRVVVEKNYRAKKWNIKGKQGYALYEWWRKQIQGIRGGHRYYYLMCLVIYACKCDVPKSKLKEDMRADFEWLNAYVEHSNPFTEDDLKSALETYSKEYYNFKIDDIEKLTDIRIERNKRNYKKQDIHIKTLNNMRKFRRDELGEDEYKNNGRPKGSG
ncbi:MAG: hypothetical protein CSA15_01960, partial [Candidatus Delongbacteria bacterium]